MQIVKKIKTTEVAQIFIYFLFFFLFFHFMVYISSYNICSSYFSKEHDIHAFFYIMRKQFVPYSWKVPCADHKSFLCFSVPHCSCGRSGQQWSYRPSSCDSRSSGGSNIHHLRSRAWSSTSSTCLIYQNQWFTFSNQQISPLNHFCI